MGRSLDDLGSKKFSWVDLRAIIRHSGSDTAYGRSAAGTAAGWGIGEYLLAIVADRLAGANWQRGGGKGSRPRPLPRPTSDENTKKYGHGTMNADELDSFLGYSLRDMK